MNQVTGIVLLACAGVSMWGQDASAYLRQADAQAKAGQYRQAVASYRQGIALDLHYAVKLTQPDAPLTLLKELMRLEGVQNVELKTP